MATLRIPGKLRLYSALPGYWGLCPARPLFPAILVDCTTKNNKKQSKRQTKKAMRSEEGELDVEVVNVEPRVMLTPVKGHNRTSSFSSSTSDKEEMPRTSGKT